MSSLFRNLHNFSSKKENSVKEALISTLTENTRDIKYDFKELGRGELELCETTSALCTTLEAIFLHGLKDSFLWQTINALAGDEERRPEPSFWPPLMVFLHKQVIQQIQSLSQITSEIGFCRAWIRQSLNESLISSYFNNIRKNTSSLSPYYKRYALIRDSGCLETVEKVLTDIEAQIQFNLPVNSSLLNQWPDYALQLSGLWTPPLKSCPVSSGIDIACSLSVDTQSIPTPQPLRTNELFSESISNSPFNQSQFAVEDLNQRENLELFLRKVDEMDIIDEDCEDTAKEADKENAENKQTVKKERDNTTHSIESKVGVTSDEGIDLLCQAERSELQHIHGNSLTNFMHTSWSSDINYAPEIDSVHSRTLQHSVSMTSSTSSLRSPLGDRCSYNTLLKKHERTRQLDWTEIWEKFLSQNTNTADADNSVLENDEGSNDSEPNSEFEVIQHSLAMDKFDLLELQKLVEQLCKLAREPGLDAQGFLCKSCQHPLGIGYSNLRVCAFNGHYYCDDCMCIEPVFIPARIIYNWDFRKSRVSKHAMNFLTEFRCQPFIDLKLLNPLIYNAAEAMAELQSLRIRLNFLRAYLCTCEPTSIELFQKQFFGKEYLYEHIHLYSVADLASIERGILYQQLHKAYKIGENHVLKCLRCSVKGFICEICKSPRVLYPFHIDTTYRCETCGAVFHAHCLNAFQPCPKCERKRKRGDLSISETKS